MNNEQQMMLVPQGSIEGYIRAANSYPILTAEEEKSLAEDFYYNNNLDAAKQLVLSHLRFVVHIARSYSGYGLAIADLIQEGNIGLMKAIKRFNPNLGVRLVSFAVHWIKAEIHEFVLKNWRIVKIATTKAQRKLFFNLRKSKKRLGWLNGNETEFIAKTLGVTNQDVMEMESRMNGNDVSFDITSEDEDDHNYSPILYLEDNNSNFSNVLEHENFNQLAVEKLSKAMVNLDERSQQIIQARWLDDNKLTLHELAERYNISAERVRQLENNALKKLKVAIEH